MSNDFERARYGGPKSRGDDQRKGHEIGHKSASELFVYFEVFKYIT
jgi:hypothetical protein